MANKQIHQLPAASDAGTRGPAGRLAGRQQRHPARQPWPACRSSPACRAPTRRTIAGKLGETVSVKDFGAVGDGAADDSAAFQAALDQHGAIHVPAGTYRLDSEIQVKPRRRLFGAGRDATVIDARGARAFTFNRNAGAFQVDAVGRRRLEPLGRLGHDHPHGQGRHPRPRPRVPRHQPPVRRRHRPAGPGRPRRLVPRSARRQRERAARDPGRLWRRGDPPPPGQRHPAGLQHALGQLRRQPAAGDLDQAGGRRHRGRAAQGQRHRPDQQRPAQPRPGQRAPGRHRHHPAGRHQRHQALERRPHRLPAVRRRGRRRLVRGIQREPGRHGGCLRQQQLCRLLRPLPGHGRLPGQQRHLHPLGDPHQLLRLRQSRAPAGRQRRRRRWPGPGRRPGRARASGSATSTASPRSSCARATRTCC